MENISQPPNLNATQLSSVTNQEDKGRVGWGVRIVSFLFFVSGLTLLIGLFIGNEEAGITSSQPIFYYLILIAILSITVSAGLTRTAKWGFWLAILLIVEAIARVIFSNYPDLTTIIPSLAISGLMLIPLITNRKKFLQ